ncbi:MAG: hypothetical protein ACRDTI_13365 [Mycobacterium sp.]
MNEQSSCRSGRPDEAGTDMALLTDLMKRLDDIAQQCAALSGMAVPTGISPVDRLAALATFHETKLALGYSPWDAVA